MQERTNGKGWGGRGSVQPILLAAVIVAMLAAAALILAMPPAKDEIAIGGPPSDAATLILTAQDRGIFPANGINATLVEYPTGMAAIDALLRGDIGIAGASEYPVVVSAFMHRNISIIGSVARSYNEYLVLRADGGIGNVSGLKGKRIALPVHTMPEFYLGRYLNLHGMGIHDVELVNTGPDLAVAALQNGSVDAAVSWYPYISRAAGGNPGIVKLPVQSGQAQYAVLVARDDWIADHPAEIKKLLRSLSQAEEYTMISRQDAKRVLADRYGYTDAYVEQVWPDNEFALSLDQSLVTAMEDESRWMIRNNLTNTTEVPDFRQFLYPDGLDAVKPGAVSIVR